MSLRRSSRSTSAKPPSQTADQAAEKTLPRSRSQQPNQKRDASSERTPSPPPKRSRTATDQKPENDPPMPARTRKPSSRTTKPPSGTAKSSSRIGRASSKDALQKKAPVPLVAKKSLAKLSPVPEAPPAPMPQQRPYFNPLPIAAPKARPGLQLFVWGAGNFGQFGMGPDVLGELDKPRKNGWVEQQMEQGTFGEVGAGLESVAGGGLHTLFIDEKGTVWSCGVNDDAALGRVTQFVPDPSNPNSFLDVDELTSIPHPLQSLVDENFRAVQVAAGDSICAALSVEGDLRVWGSFRAHEGSLGFSSGLKHQFLPVPILGLKEKPGDSEKVSSIAAGSNHLLVLTTHGNILTWGAGEQSQLGRKVLERRKIHGTVPEKVTLGNRSRKAVKIGAGAFHSFAVDDRGDVWAWGLNSMGQTGTGWESSDDGVVQLPQKVKQLSKEELGGDFVVQVEGGTHHTLFLTNNGKVYACGRSNAGQLGLADDDAAFNERIDPDFVPEPVLVTFPDPDDPIMHISCGVHNNMAVTQGGALYCWGQGVQGELGVAEVEVKTPRVIVRKEGGSWTAVSVSCGGQHTLGLFRKK